MVIFSEWHRTAVDQKRFEDLLMTGEDAGLGPLAPPLAGYLGKVRERCSSLEFCPWCTAKGLTFHVRSFRINFQQSIKLCTNPQCLFPLVSQPLENVLASLMPPEPKAGSKRKSSTIQEKTKDFVPSPKRFLSEEEDGDALQAGADTQTHKTDSTNETFDYDGNGQASPVEVRKLRGYQRDTGDLEALKNVPGTVTLPETVTEDTVSTHVSTSPQAASQRITEDEGDTKPGFVEVALSPARTEDVLEHDNLPMRRPSSGGAGGEIEEQCVAALRHEGSLCEDVCTPSLGTGVDGENKLDSDQDNQSSEQHEMHTDVINQMGSTMHCKVMTDTKPEDLPLRDKRTRSENRKDTTTSQPMVSAPHELFWKNENNLCWLDVLMVALVNCRSLRRSKPKTKRIWSPVWQLITDYQKACSLIRDHQHDGKDGVTRVPKNMLEKVESDLQELRMNIFKFLQPKLRCHLGQQETPVFAIPLLFKTDSWAKPVFQLSHYWEFKCSECRSSSNLKASNVLSTFTNILPDWHPLRAAHLTSCNACGAKNQSRKMVFESLPPVLALHFVEGLKDNDLAIYSFNFEGIQYSVSTVIQYDQLHKHFIAWVCKPNGSWLEFDDLKHPSCVTHATFPVPAEDIHIVFWEEEEEMVDCVLSNEGSVAADVTVKSPDQSVITQHNDSDIVCALTVSHNADVVDTTEPAGGDACIGSTTLLDTFEGLTHEDIVTLTLTEVQPDSESLADGQQTNSNGFPVMHSPTTQTSSLSPVKSDELPHDSPSDRSSAEESVDNLSSDPTFEPSPKQRTRRGNARRAVKGKQAESAKKAPKKSKKESVAVVHSTEQQSKPLPDTVSDTPLPVSKPPEAAPAAPPVSEPNFDRPPLLDSTSRWSHLLSMHPASQPRASSKQSAPLPQVKPPIPSHSTPNLVRRQPVPFRSQPAAQLRREDGKAMPLKPAEVYDAFGARRTSNCAPQAEKLSQLPSLVTTQKSGPLQKGQAVACFTQKPKDNTTVVPTVLLSPIGATAIPKVASKRLGSHSSKIPSNLTDTEALRYKLLKKLKAKKKKLEKLNQLLGQSDGKERTPRPDSTNLSSPYSVSSSTYDQFFDDILSPTTTTSGLSPDSTGLVLSNGQEGDNNPEYRGNATGGVSLGNALITQMDTQLTQLPVPKESLISDNFLEEFMSESALSQQTEMEAEDLSALDLFF